MRYIIFSTYPKDGSQNSGDKLIERSTINLIKSQDPGAEFEVIWRAASLDQVSEALDRCDVVVFACFAIRRDIERVYPSIDLILRSKKQIFVLSAGTDLPLTSSRNLEAHFKSSDISKFRLLAEKSTLFTTRARLTHNFCEAIGLASAHYTGDVAFFNSLDSAPEFKRSAISTVVISSPHREHLYVQHSKNLIDGIQDRFPRSKIIAAVHGKDSGQFIDVARSRGLEICFCHKELDGGLDIYDQCDLHVGFRVHGHVSALKRGSYSYLLEQDGRGVDYGLSFSRKISVPAFSIPTPGLFISKGRSSLKSFAKAVLGRPTTKQIVPLSCIDQVLSLIDRDLDGNFKSFDGLEYEVAEIQNSLRLATSKAIKNINENHISH